MTMQAQANTNTVSLTWAAPMMLNLLRDLAVSLGGTGAWTNTTALDTHHAAVCDWMHGLEALVTQFSHAPKAGEFARHYSSLKSLCVLALASLQGVSQNNPMACDILYRIRKLLIEQGEEL